MAGSLVFKYALGDFSTAGWDGCQFLWDFWPLFWPVVATPGRTLIQYSDSLNPANWKTLTTIDGNGEVARQWISRSPSKIILKDCRLR